jgi:uncharacterized membrane protein
VLFLIPTEKELIEFIKKRDNLVNFSLIAKFYEIKNTTVSDIIADLEKKKVVKIRKLGGSKIVMVK